MLCSHPPYDGTRAEVLWLAVFVLAWEGMPTFSTEGMQSEHATTRKAYHDCDWKWSTGGFT